MPGIGRFIWQNRHGTYYFRVVIPAAVREHFSQQRELRRSLATSDRKLALKLARACAVQFDELCEDLMAKRRRKTNKQEKPLQVGLITILGLEMGDGKRAERVTIDYGGDHEREVAAANALITSAASDTVAAGTGTTTSEVVKAYCDERIQSDGWTPKTTAENQAIFDLFVRIVGDEPFKRLKHEAMRKYKATLMKLPPNMNKDARYRGLSIEHILALDGVQPMAVNTINKNLIRISSLFDWAARHGYTDQNYGKGLTLQRKARVRDERAVFSHADLLKLFRSPELEAGVEAPYQYWVPLIGLYSGARLEEICQLALDDIRREADIWVLDINGAGEKRLKTPAAKRLIPLHRVLIELGLPAYVDKLRAAGHDRLFPELTRQRDGYSARVSKWFARYRHRCGVTDKSKTFHSFRHTFVDAIKQTGAVEGIASALAGHEHGGISYGRYGKDYSVSSLSNCIESLMFNLDHLQFK